MAQQPRVWAASSMIVLKPDKTFFFSIKSDSILPCLNLLRDWVTTVLSLYFLYSNPYFRMNVRNSVALIGLPLPVPPTPGI